MWVRQAQAERFAEDGGSLKGNKWFAKRSPLTLSPLIDEEGLLRVGGRLTRADLPYDTRHPMILPKKHHITRLIIADVHDRCRHAGVNHVLAEGIGLLVDTDITQFRAEIFEKSRVVVSRDELLQRNV